MNTIKTVAAAFFLIAAGFACPAAAADIDMPRIREVKIAGPVTRLIIDILPGRGVKCIFPWVLDEKSEPTPARIVITNDTVFEQLRGDNQNSIEFKIKAKGQGIEGEVCDAFVSVAGFHFDFTLRVNFSKKAHCSTILFELDDAKKYELIEEAVRKRRMELEKEYQAAGADPDERLKKQSLKLIARTVLQKPEKSNVFERQGRRLENGDMIIFSADKILTFGDIHILQISIENDSRINPLYVNGIQLAKMSGNTQPLFSEYEIAPRIDAGEIVEGFVVTRDPRIIDGEDSQMKLLTDKGEVELKW